MHFYQWFAWLCEKKHVTIPEAYNAIGINKGTVSKWKSACEAGKEALPSMKIAKGMAEYFGMSVEDILQMDEREASAKMLQSLRDEDRALLDVAKGMTPEQVKLMTEFAKSLKGDN